MRGIGWVSSSILDPVNASSKHTPKQGRGQHGRHPCGELTGESPAGYYTLDFFRNKTCYFKRRWQLRKQLRCARECTEFRAAERAAAEANTSATDTAGLVAALQSRAVARTHLGEQVYQTPPWADARYHAYCAERKELHRFVTKVLGAQVRLCALLCAWRPGADAAHHVHPQGKYSLVWGNANISMDHMKGSSSGFGNRIFRACNLYLKKEQMLAMVDENRCVWVVHRLWRAWLAPDTPALRCGLRTSLLDPYTNAVMVHPVLPAKKDKNGHWKVRTQWGNKMCVLGDYSMRWNRDISAPLNMMLNWFYELVHGVRARRPGAAPPCVGAWLTGPAR